MNNFTVQIKETYIYKIEVEADTKADAMKKAKEIYHDVPEGYSFTADATSHEETTFTLE